MEKNSWLCIAGFFFAMHLPAQTLHTIDSLEQKEQHCLDKGEHMTGCVAVFRQEMDSLVKISLLKLSAKSNHAGKAALQKDQLQWLARQTQNDRKIKTRVHQEMSKDGWEGGEVERISIFGEQTDFVRNRARSLVKKLSKSPPANL